MSKQLPLHFEFRANQGFSDFFVGSNLETVAHLQKSATGLGEQQIYLWGKSGLGKSHLLKACCQQAQELKRSNFYLELSASRLPEASILMGLDEIELVCIDNIDQFSGNPIWERAFFNFYNQHRERCHTLVVSAPCPVQDLALNLPDLETRLNWGLSLKIQDMNDDDKVSALAFRAKQMGFEISPQIGHYLLNHCDRELSSLWILLEKLDKASLSAKRLVTIPFIKQVLAEVKNNNR